MTPRGMGRTLGRSSAALLIAVVFSTPAASAQQEPGLDSLVLELMAEHVTPGLALSVVRDGVVQNLSAYGLASVEEGRAFDAHETNFRTASVAKLFVATLVTQLAARGVLDLHRDVREYIPEFPFGDTFAHPVTLHHLLTHTAGLDDRLIGYAARSPGQMRPLGEYLAGNFPRQGWRPGDVTGYSNHGMALAAYIVERVTGEDFAEYAREALFVPLGMHATGYIQAPLGPERTARGHACGSQVRSCSAESVPYSHAYPVGLAYSTAADMARFATAHLEGGRLNGVQVLDPEGLSLMQTEQFTHAPGLPGMSYGFFNQRQGTLSLLAHSGSAGGLDALLLLVPDRRAGIFFVVNGGRSDMGVELRDLLLERMFGEEARRAPVGAASSVDPARLARFAGPYQLTRAAHHTVESLLFAFGMSARVEVTPAGRLRLPYDGGSEYEPVDSLRFRRVGGGDEIVFRSDERGRITHLFAGVPAFGALMPGALERRAWYDDPGIMNEFLSFLVGVPLIILLLLWPLTGLASNLVRRWKGGAAHPPVPGTKLAFGLALLFSLLHGVFTFAGVARSLRMLAASNGITYGMTADMALILSLPYAMAPLGVAVIWCSWVAWRKRYWDAVRRAYYSVVALGVVLSLIHLVRWNYLPPVW